MGFKHLTREEKTQIMTLFNQGSTCSELAVIMNRPSSTISRIINGKNRKKDRPPAAALLASPVEIGKGSSVIIIVNGRVVYEASH